MNWEVKYLPAAEKGYQSFSRRQQLLIDKAIKKIKTNPLPKSEGGYGKPLGHKMGTNLTGYLKVKLRNEGIRIVYKLIRTKTRMLIIVIGMREDDEVYELVKNRIKKSSL